MTKLRFEQNLEIEDARNHPAEMVEKLRPLLAQGAQAQEDPRRKNFYEVDNGSIVYYIHVCPASGKVHLLATWPKEGLAAIAQSDAPAVRSGLHSSN